MSQYISILGYYWNKLLNNQHLWNQIGQLVTSNWLLILSSVMFLFPCYRTRPVSLICLTLQTQGDLKLYFGLGMFLLHCKKTRQVSLICETLQTQLTYRIYLAIRRGFPTLDWVQIIKSVLCNFAVIHTCDIFSEPDREIWDFSEGDWGIR